MKYFKTAAGAVHGYDGADQNQQPLIAAATAAGWTDVTATWPPAPAPVSLPVQAQAVLDVVTGQRGQIVRCMAAGVPVPLVWSQYVAALRAIVNGTDKGSVALPVQPAYVAGT